MRHEVAIVGGGIVGLTLAALLSKNNFSVALIEAKKFQSPENNLTARVSAIHITSQKLFEHMGIWDSLKNNAAPLFEMKIWDHTQNTHLHFDSRDVNEMQMGFIVENRAIIKILYEKLTRDKNIEIFCPVNPTDFNFEKNNLMVGADGANSWVRKQMSITMQTRSYQQKAIIAVIESEKPHENIAYQKFLTTGPVALLPLKNSHHTALVWSADNVVSDELMQKNDLEFSMALTQALDFKLGKLKIISERSQFILTMQHADDYASENYVLVGDAAHTIHPLAGLGVNLGLMDTACLTQTLINARKNKKSVNDLRVLRSYSRLRKSENSLVICAMRALKEMFALDLPMENVVRSFAVNTIDQCEPMKNYLMRIAMGQSKELPEFLQS